MDRSLMNEEVDGYQFKLRDKLVSELKCELRWLYNLLKMLSQKQFESSIAFLQTYKDALTCVE